MNLGTALQQTGQRLAATSPTAALDAQVLLGHILGRPKAWVLAHPEYPLEIEAAEALETAVQQLEGGEPLPYVLGHWEFFGLDFRVSPDVLIPRPETELLVETALAWLRDQLPEPNNRPRLAADVGTGSGCIAVSLAVYYPNLRITATDISHKALQVARKNAILHKVADRISLVQGNLLSPIAYPPVPMLFDLICANLPYIPANSLPGLAVARREPHLALDGGEDGLELIRRLLRQAPDHLAPDGLLLLEIEAGQGLGASTLASQAFPRAQVQLLPDLAGRDRIVRIEP